MRVAIITECALSRAHGTGAQVLRLFEGSDADVRHYYFSADYAGLSECAKSHRLQDPSWRWRGKKIAMRVERGLGLSWWDGTTIRADRFRKLLAANGHAADVAYVVVACERDARRAASLLESLSCPYVVHVMDLYHRDGLCPREMPGFGQLVAGASSVLALNEAIAAEVAKFHPSCLRTVPFGHTVTSALARAADRPVRVVMAGKPYPAGTDLIARAWPDVLRQFPRAELAYVGQHASSLPRSLRRNVRNYGYVPDDSAFQRVLLESHVAYLSGPSEDDHFARYSVPSRTSDYLMAGLPTLACVAPESATGKFLAPLVPHAVRLVRSAEQVADGLRAFAGDAGSWRAASGAARAFAVSRLSMDAARGEVLAALATAARSRVRGEVHAHA